MRVDLYNPCASRTSSPVFCYNHKAGGPSMAGVGRTSAIENATRVNGDSSIGIAVPGKFTAIQVQVVKLDLAIVGILRQLRRKTFKPIFLLSLRTSTLFVYGSIEPSEFSLVVDVPPASIALSLKHALRLGKGHRLKPQGLA